MVAPTTYRDITPVATSDDYIALRYYSQKPPYDRMLPMNNRYHQRRDQQGPSAVELWSKRATSSLPMEPRAGSARVWARNRSYTNLVGKLGDQSSLGATVTAERRETYAMMVTLITRLLRVVQSLKRLDFASAAQGLGLPYLERTRTHWYYVTYEDRNGRRRKRRIGVKKTYFDWGTGRLRLKTAAAGWLMFSYGVKPLATDIYNAVDLLQRPFPFSNIHGKATEPIFYSRSGSYGPYSYYAEVRGRMSVKQSIDVRVSNPNLWTANRLGLVNPATWILEAIPLSFVVDWFSNLSSVVQSWTDFTGLETRNPVVNECCDVHGFGWDIGWAGQYSYCRGRDRYTVRSLSIVTPKLSLRYERFNWQRGLNAISLLIGALKR